MDEATDGIDWYVYQITCKNVTPKTQWDGDRGPVRATQMIEPPPKFLQRIPSGKVVTAPLQKPVLSEQEARCTQNPNR